MSTIYRYRIYCENEQQYVYIWDTVPPTVCPNDATPVNEDKLDIVETLSQNTSIVEEPTFGYFQSQSYVMDIPAGNIGDTTIMDITWPLDVQIWKSDLIPLSNQIGDTIYTIISPNTTVGLLTSDANIGQNIITVSDTVIANVANGFDITLTNGTITENLGQIIHINTSTKQLTMEKTLTQNFLTSTPTYVQFSYIMVKNQVIVNTDTIKYGEKGLKYKLLPANTIMRILYKNNSGSEKKCNWRIEYYMKS